ncbi:hypothetical protein FNV43_RR04604 [Rhamnella rubrinervis]|uniref:Uncharacterized protein n=1 Tax=Rhamnella rubrinervis TaxID=2594499 RepID=A0A8K0HJW1_9ROSA|nr:hypothetical protein FNV43_RR04604 [Rhamnella rubrinervis]
MLSFEAPKIRLLRNLSIENETMQNVTLSMLVSPIRIQYQERSILGFLLKRDLNPLHDVIIMLSYEFLLALQAWLQLMKEATEEADPSGLNCNRVAEELPVFNGIDELGSKSSLDYFPEYRCEDGTTNEKRSMVGKSFESRPWDTNGEFIGLSWKAITKPPECSSQLSLLESIPAFAQRVVCWQIDSDDIYSPSKIFAFHSSFYPASSWVCVPVGLVELR